MIIDTDELLERIAIAELPYYDGNDREHREGLETIATERESVFDIIELWEWYKEE